MPYANENAPTVRVRGASDNSIPRDTIHRAGESVDAQIQETLWRVLRGELELHQVTPGLSAWMMAGADIHAATCCQAEIERLTRERDYFYCLYANGWTPAEYMRRQTDALWDEAVSA